MDTAEGDKSVSGCLYKWNQISFYWETVFSSYT